MGELKDYREFRAKILAESRALTYDGNSIASSVTDKWGPEEWEKYWKRVKQYGILGRWEKNDAHI